MPRPFYAHVLSLSLALLVGCDGSDGHGTGPGGSDAAANGGEAGAYGGDASADSGGGGGGFTPTPITPIEGTASSEYVTDSRRLAPEWALLSRRPL